MVAPEGTNWLCEYGVENMVNFSAPNSGCSWPPQALSGSSSAGGASDGSFGRTDRQSETGSKKRTRADACTPSSKACREKQRRDRLNDRFMDLAALLDSGQPPKANKSAILVNAVRIIGQLKSEADELKNSNLNLQEKIKELKKEKAELREVKHKFKAEKERLEQQLKSMSTPQTAAFGTASQDDCNKVVPVIGYPGASMWQFMPPTAVDTSQDHALRPPVA